MVRRDLRETMSQYLIDRIAALEGDRTNGLTAATFQDRRDGCRRRLAVRHLFLFVGAAPNSDWARDCVETNGHGFVVTGNGPLPSETTVPGMFAIGDVRAGSTKRVAAAVGEGAAVVSQIHAKVAARAMEQPVGKCMMACSHTSTIRKVTPSTSGCEECLKIGSEWLHLRICRECGHVGCCDQSPHRHARAHFHQTKHPIIEGYDPPEGWGWCYVDDVEVELEDQTPQDGPIPCFY